MIVRRLGPEVLKSDYGRKYSGFYDKYMSGCGVDIGYMGDSQDNVPVTANALGLELGRDGYDGVHIKCADGAYDFIFSSHCLEHIDDPLKAIREWYRAVKVGGYIICMVPHKYLYEKKDSLPSRFNGDHKIFYTPASLLFTFECALQPNSYRVVHLRDNDTGYDYSIPPERHASGAYEIELVLRKIEKPTWGIDSGVAVSK